MRISSSEIQEFEISHINKVRKLASEGTLFLKKDDHFPVKPTNIVAVGSGVRKTLKGGTGSGDVYIRHLVSVEEGLKNAGFNILSIDWLDKYDNLIKETRKNWIAQIQKEAKEAKMHTVLYAMGKIMGEPEYHFDLDYPTDTAIYVLSRISGEGSDRSNTQGDILLTDTEINDILYLNEKYDNFMLVLNVGGYVDLSEVKNVKNILLLGQLGTPTGDILADIITGKSYPSGKLTMTHASIYSYPSTKGFADLSDTYYYDDIYVGYRYFNFKKNYQYPFGFGLSYTSFNINTLNITKNNKKIFLEIKVDNVGNYKGKEVVQVYKSAINLKNYPYSELIAYKKTKELNPKENETFIVSFNIDSLASFDVSSNSYIIKKGIYAIKVGNSSIDTKNICYIKANNDIVCEECNKINATNFKVDSFDLINNENIDSSLNVIEINKDDVNYIKHTDEEYKELNRIEKKYSFNEVKNNSITVEEFVSSLNDYSLAMLCVGKHVEENIDKVITAVGFNGDSVPGSAGETTSYLSNLDVPILTMADGPAGLRIATRYSITDTGFKVKDGDIVNDSEFLTDEERAYIEAMNGGKDKDDNATIYYQNTIAIPIGTSIAQSFNDDVAYELGNIVGEEMEIFNVNLWLAPALNIQRNPLCGRNFEYYSEDPFLSGKIAAGIVKGVKSHKGRTCVIKHFACNNQETNRVLSNSIVNERALREIYLKGFEIVVKEANANVIMTANNLINDVHTSESKDINISILRNEWNFKGFEMTDWYVTSEVMCSMFKGSRWKRATAFNNIKGGNELTMPGEANDVKEIMDHLHKDLKLADIQHAVINMLNVIKELK